MYVFRADRMFVEEKRLDGEPYGEAGGLPGRSVLIHEAMHAAMDSWGNRHLSNVAHEMVAYLVQTIFLISRGFPVKDIATDANRAIYDECEKLVRQLGLVGTPFDWNTAECQMLIQPLGRAIFAVLDSQEPNGNHNRPPAGLGVPPSRL
jgi:hypothetical protein